MYDYVFLRIINCEDFAELCAIEKAIQSVETISEKEKMQLDILCSMQKQIVLQKELISECEKTNDAYKDIINCYNTVVKSANELIGELHQET